MQNGMKFFLSVPEKYSSIRFFADCASLALNFDCISGVLLPAASADGIPKFDMTTQKSFPFSANAYLISNNTESLFELNRNTSIPVSSGPLTEAKDAIEPPEKSLSP